jgi:ketosteroid isomerase-like protein
MRKIFIITPLLLFAGRAVGQTSKTNQVDFETEKAAVADLFDKYYSAINVKDAATLPTFLTEDVLVCGTDPSEFWNKAQITDAWTQGLADPTLEINITIGKREIRVADDGSSAIVVEQYIMPFLSSKIHIRTVSYAVKTNDKWMIDFMSFNLIPKNEDISKINKALE